MSGNTLKEIQPPPRTTIINDNREAAYLLPHHGVKVGQIRTFVDDLDEGKDLFKIYESYRSMTGKTMFSMYDITGDRRNRIQDDAYSIYRYSKVVEL